MYSKTLSAKSIISIISVGAGKALFHKSKILVNRCCSNCHNLNSRDRSRKSYHGKLKIAQLRQCSLVTSRVSNYKKIFCNHDGDIKSKEYKRPRKILWNLSVSSFSTMLITSPQMQIITKSDLLLTSALWLLSWTSFSHLIWLLLSVNL